MGIFYLQHLPHFYLRFKDSILLNASVHFERSLGRIYK